MSDDLDDVCRVLEASLRKNGDKPLTVSHLLNILKLVARQQREDEQQEEERLSAYLAGTDHLWR
jgi:hypothetical protein